MFYLGFFFFSKYLVELESWFWKPFFQVTPSLQVLTSFGNERMVRKVQQVSTIALRTSLFALECKINSKLDDLIRFQKSTKMSGIVLRKLASLTHLVILQCYEYMNGLQLLLKLTHHEPFILSSIRYWRQTTAYLICAHLEILNTEKRTKDTFRDFVSYFFLGRWSFISSKPILFNTKTKTYMRGMNHALVNHAGGSLCLFTLLVSYFCRRYYCQQARVQKRKLAKRRHSLSRLLLFKSSTTRPLLLGRQ